MRVNPKKLLQLDNIYNYLHAINFMCFTQGVVLDIQKFNIIKPNSDNFFCTIVILANYAES